LKKKITLAITGHRDMVETEELKKELEDYFEKTIASNKDKEITLLSPLADGADRFVAKIFLEKQKEHENLKLVVPMPFEQERYEKDFDESSKEEFLDFWAKAESVFAVKRVSESGYVDVGRYVVDESDVLLALWDGTFNGKLGGTGDVVEYARHMGKEVVHFVCERENLK
jgi:uncharacterized phage-like protein YoqJ